MEKRKKNTEYTMASHEGLNVHDCDFGYNLLQVMIFNTPMGKKIYNKINVRSCYTCKNRDKYNSNITSDRWLFDFYLTALEFKLLKKLTKLTHNLQAHRHTHYTCKLVIHLMELNTCKLHQNQHKILDKYEKPYICGDDEICKFHKKIINFVEMNLIIAIFQILSMEILG